MKAHGIFDLRESIDPGKPGLSTRDLAAAIPAMVGDIPAQGSLQGPAGRLVAELPGIDRLSGHRAGPRLVRFA